MTGQLTNHLWQSTFFALAVVLLTLVFRGNRAKVRYWLWLAASFKFLIPFALLMTLGSRLHLASTVQEVVTPVVSYAAYAVETIAQPFPVALPIAPAAPRGISWAPVVIIGLWLCGFVALAVMRVCGWLRIRGAVRAGSPIDIPASVEVRVSQGLLEPGVVGLVRPVLLLPEGIVQRLTPLQLEAVIAHELCHVRRRDNLFAAVHMIVETLFWFHPLVWWIGARLVEEREKACDEEVLNLGNQPRVYADAILGVCKLYSESPLVCVSGVTGANIRKRIEAIMANRRQSGLNYAKKLLLAGAGAAALVVPIAVGVLVGIGHLPLIKAQSPTILPPVTQISPPIPALVPRTNTIERAVTAAASPVGVEDRRLVAALFDLSSMTLDERTRVRSNAMGVLGTHAKAGDLITVMAADKGEIAVLQDFTADRAVLQSTILKLRVDGDNVGSASGPRPATIEAAATMLAPFPEKKALIYFSAGVNGVRGEDVEEMRRAITTARAANVAIFPIDTREGVPPATPAEAWEQIQQRTAEAKAKFGSVWSLTRTYVKYGPPDKIEDHGLTQIWRYDYLAAFRSNVELELGLDGTIRVNWPRTTSLVGVASGTPLPAGHSYLQVYGRGAYIPVYYPFDSLSGLVQADVSFQERLGNGTLRRAGTAGSVGVSPGGRYESSFSLAPGSYVCTVSLTETASGRTFVETIDFEFK